MKHGYSFVWLAGRDPCFITRDATSIIPCTVRSGVPYLDPDDPKCEPCLLERMERSSVHTGLIANQRGKKVVLVAPLPKDSSCTVGIDPGITALPAVFGVD